MSNVTWARNAGGLRSNPSLTPAIALFDKVMDPLKIDSLGVADLVAGNGSTLLADFCTRIGNNPPIGQRTKKPMACSALKKYIEALCACLRDRFGRENEFRNYSLFPSDEVGQLKKTFEDYHGRTRIIGSEEDALLRDYYPIPRKHDFSNTTQATEARSVDLFSICNKLLRTHQFLNWILLLCTMNAVGRGGEVKFLSYDKMFWDCYFGMLFFQWFQRKELKTSPSAYCVDFLHPELCVLFAFGCHWALEDGSVRSNVAMANPGSPEYRVTKFVFQSLHRVVDSSVAGQLTSMIRSCLHRLLQPYYTVKSLRAGAMSMLSWLPTVTYEECIAIGGWSTKASRDWCVWQCLVAVIPGALALAGYPDPRQLPYNSSFETLFSDPQAAYVFPRNKFQDFLGALFPNSLPEFAQNGRLRPFMVVVAAVMVKNYRHMQEKYGADPRYVHKMRAVVVRVGLARDLPTASEKLRHWSKKLLDDAGANQEEERGGVLMRTTVADKLHELSSNVSDLLRSRQQDQLSQSVILQEVREVKAGQSDIKTNLQELTTAIQELTIALQNNTMPRTPRTPARTPIPAPPPAPPR